MFNESSNTMLKKKPPAAKPTVPLAVWATRTTVEELLSLYDGWRALLPYDVPDQVGRLRQRHDGEESDFDGDENLRVGASVPRWLVDDIHEHSQRYDRTRSYILTWCLKAGLSAVTVNKLLAAYVDLKPTMSLVVVAALKLGFAEWEHKYGVINYAGRLDPASPERRFVRRGRPVGSKRGSSNARATAAANA